MEWRILPDPGAVAREACRLITKAARQATGERGRFSLVLAGGPSRRPIGRRPSPGSKSWRGT